MQEIRFYVSAAGTVGICKDSYGVKTVDYPTIIRGSEVMFKIRLLAGLDENNDPLPPENLSEILSWQFVMDADYKEATPCLLVADNANITLNAGEENGVSYTELSVPLPETNTAELKAWLGSEPSKKGLNAEISGVDGNGKIVFLLQMDGFTVRNRIASTGAPTPLPDSYYNKTQVNALLLAGYELQFSADGKSWSATQQESSKWIRSRHRTLGGAWSDPVQMLQGPAGRDGIDGKSIDPDLIAPLSQRPAGPVEGFCFLASDTGTLYWFSGGAWSAGTSITTIQGPQGPAGKDGKNGAVGPQGERGLQGLPGEPGSSLVVDMTGTLAQRHVYDDALRGFRFLATDLYSDDSTTHKYQMYYFKQSDIFGDWSEGIRLYVGIQGPRGLPGIQGPRGPRGENAEVVPDFIFAAADIFGGSLIIEGVRPVAQVELVINEAGDTRVIVGNELVRVCYAENHTLVYLEGLDYSSGGRVRFAQGLQAKSPYQIWLSQGHDGSEEDYLNWLRGMSAKYPFTQADLDDTGKLIAVLENTVTAVIDGDGLQWQLQQNAVRYTDSATAVDLAGIMAMKGVSAITGTWYLAMTGGTQGEIGPAGPQGEPGPTGPTGPQGVLTVVVSATAPANPTPGMIWVQS